MQRVRCLRKSLPVVRNGSYTEFDHENEQLYVYAREWEDQKMLVVCSFSDDAIAFSMPAGFAAEEAELILGNYDEPQAALQPWECRVYLWK